MRAPLHGPWQILAGVLGPARLPASDAPIHQRTCDVTGSQAMWFHQHNGHNSDNDSIDNNDSDNDEVSACWLRMG